MTPDERVVWVRAASGRKLVQIIEPTPTGFSVTTQWLEHEKIVRQDVSVALREVAGAAHAAEFNRRGVDL